MNAIKTYTDSEFNNLNISFTYIKFYSTFNSGSETLYTLNTVLETKEALSCITEVEKAAAEYQFTLIYDDTAGWWAVKDAYSLKLEYIYVNDDDVPELVVSDGTTFASGAYLYTYKDGEVMLLGQFGCYGDLQYSAKNNVILTDLTRQGTIDRSYYRIQDGAASLIHHFVCEYDQSALLNSGTYICSNYKLDGVSVSELEYNAALAEVTDGIAFAAAGNSTGQYMYQVMGD